MSCNGCGSTAYMTKDQVENLINQLVSNGTLSPSLSDCDGSTLSKGAKLVLCNTLAEKVNSLIKSGTIDVITDVSVKDGKLVITDGTGKENTIATPFITDLAFDESSNTLNWKADGTSKSAKLPYTKAVAGDNGVVLTLANGTTVEVPKSSSALTGDSFDYTIKKGTNVDGKYGVNLKANGGLEYDKTGAISVKLGSGLTQNSDGSIGVSSDTTDAISKRVSTLESDIVPVYDASGTVIQFYAARGV